MCDMTLVRRGERPLHSGGRVTVKGSDTCMLKDATVRRCKEVQQKQGDVRRDMLNQWRRLRRV